MPVTIATGNSPTAKKFILNKRCDTVTVEGVGPDDWILVRINLAFVIQTIHTPDIKTIAMGNCASVCLLHYEYHQTTVTEYSLGFC